MNISLKILFCRSTKFLRRESSDLLKKKSESIKIKNLDSVKTFMPKPAEMSMWIRQFMRKMQERVASKPLKR